MPQRWPRGPCPCFSFPENALSSPQGLITSTHSVPLPRIGSPDGLLKGFFRQLLTHDFINLSLTSVSHKRPWDPRGQGLHASCPYSATENSWMCSRQVAEKTLSTFSRWPLRPSLGKGCGVLSQLEATVQHSSSQGRGAEPWLCAMRWGDADKGHSSSPRGVQPVR